MENLLLLEDVVNRATQQEAQRMVLFGKKGYATMASVDYDFFFHALPVPSFNNLREGNFLTVPLLPYQEDRDAILLEIANTCEKSPCLSLFGTRDKKPKIQIASGKEAKVEGTFLKFFDVSRSPNGIEIAARDEYRVACMEEFQHHVHDVERFLTDLSRFREEIDRQYQR